MFAFYLNTLYKYIIKTRIYRSPKNMKKTIALLAVISMALPALAAEPLLLEPLSPTVLSTTPGLQSTTTQNGTTTADPNSVQVSLPGGFTGTYDSNMIPQNAAAEGKPVPEKPAPKVRIRTKQRSQGNSYWNAGGKGTKSYF